MQDRLIGRGEWTLPFALAPYVPRLVGLPGFGTDVTFDILPTEDAGLIADLFTLGIV